MQLILASSSRYRREMLERLRLPFQCISPSIDETPLPGESPVQTCERLGLLKAKAVANLHPNAIVIGSDQVADVNGEAISKPGHHEAAVAQLTAMSGKSITFHSAVSVVHQASGKEVSFCVPTVVEFRTLSAQEIERYLLAEQPYDCAGSAKSEGLGITLLNRIESCDPTALIGLPLIELSKALRKLGVSLP
ncbi:MAG: Maf family protein [Limnobacter sp.]|uniref:Maf family protein n=1 Tax=Limnobacter sp. TaxID=2003368 RepID=UPI00391DBA16